MFMNILTLQEYMKVIMLWIVPFIRLTILSDRWSDFTGIGSKFGGPEGRGVCYAVPVI